MIAICEAECNLLFAGEAFALALISVQVRSRQDERIGQGS
jgi:hypothetical protein